MNTKEVEKKIGIKFHRIELLEEALTHRSYLNENPKWKRDNNERLEFLGDAVLELVITDDIFNRFPKDEEGKLTVIRAALVNSKNLSVVAKEIGLDKALLLSRGEAKDKSGKGRDSISANSVEALIGAIYLDQGYEAAKTFIKKNILVEIENILKDGGKDAKSMVQEFAQAEFKVTPTYEVLEETGPAHNRLFKVGLYFNGELRAEGEGRSKQEAELAAAENFLNKNR